MFDFIKEEAEKRKREEEELKAFVEQEKERIAERRSNAKKSMIRKIKPIDNIQSNRERKHDEKELSHFEETQRSYLKQERARRKKSILKENFGLIAGAVIALVVMVGGGSFFGYNFYQSANVSRISDQYDQAIEYILEEDYQSARDTLEGFSVRDSDVLLEYCDIQLSLSDYKGRAGELIDTLDELDVIEDEDVSDQYDEACVEVENVRDIQEEIDEIDNETISADSSDEIDGITDEIESVKERYRVVLDTEKYDLAEATITNIEEETPVGVTILAISGLDEITLDSADEISRARTDYDNLSESEQAEVVNYGELTEAESELEVLQAEKDRIKKEKAKKKKAREKAKAEAEKKKKEAEEKSYLNQTVYRTNTGGCYHVDGCSYLKSKIAITLGEAKSMGLSPCSRCHPPY